MQHIQLKKESGRSMVEMLGVLAIIGVLSIGGIAGYKFAMNQIIRNNMLTLFDLFALSVEEISQDYINKETPYDRNDAQKLAYFCSTYLGSCGEQKIRNISHASAPNNGVDLYTGEYNGILFGVSGGGIYNRIEVFMLIPANIGREYVESVLSKYKQDIESFTIHYNNRYPLDKLSNLFTTFKTMKNKDIVLYTSFPWDPIE